MSAIKSPLLWLGLSAVSVAGFVLLSSKKPMRVTPVEPDPDEPDDPDDPIVEPPAPPQPEQDEIKLLDWTSPPKSVVPQMFAQAHIIDRALETTGTRKCLEWEVYRTHTPFVVNGKQHDTVLMYRSCFDSDWMPFEVAKGKTEDQIRDLEVRNALNDIRAETLSAYTKAVFW